MREKQEEYARLVSAGLSRADAYKQAYNRPDLSNDQASKNAWRLEKKREVVEKKKKLAAVADVRAVIARERRMELLSARAEECYSEGKTKDMVQCIAELNKMDGAYEPAKVEVQGDIVRDFVRAQIEKASAEPLVKK